MVNDMYIKKILEKACIKYDNNLNNHYINSIKDDSRNVMENDVFFAIKGGQTDGKLYIDEAIEKGANIKIISFNAFLEMIGLSEDELDSLPMVSFDSLSRDDAVIKDPRTRRYFEKKKSKEVVTVSAQDHKTTLGNLFGDLFAKLKEDLED